MKFYIKRLGCPKNDVDGDYLAARLLEAGHEMAADDTAAEAVIVNTCGFILPAKMESIEEILQYEKARKNRTIKRLYVTGCLSQRYGADLAREIKGLDGIFGLGQWDQLAAAMNDEKASGRKPPLNISDDLTYLAADRRYIDSDLPYAYLKISDGCDRFCSYCAIPHIRGRYRSRPPEEIVREAERLAAAGKKEIILVSQEGTGYGRDLPDENNVVSLLKQVEKIDGIEWIRLMYLHPDAVTEELIEYLSHAPKMLGYFDLPLQHINDDILKCMKRPLDRSRTEQILNRIRNASAQNIIRTTFMVGFPGETEAQFGELCDFVAAFEFDRLGVFGYSQEEDTAAAGFADQFDEKTIENRKDALMLLQQKIAFAKNIALIGTFQKVIIDAVNDEWPAIGRTRGDCPEIDQSVFIRQEGLQPGEIVTARIIMTEGYDLIAEIAREAK